MNSEEANANELSSQYDPATVEQAIYQQWLDADLFRADPHSKKEKYVIVFPPPNVTGVLHIGHALTCTLEDILIRYKRMLGFEALWVPGTDHAGIATQMVVERKLLKEEKKSRHDLGREKFLEKIWEFKEQSQSTILNQMKLMGCSVDWSRLRFTLDEVSSLAVREAFYRLYQEKLLYRDTAMIQWCPRCRTALSDLEVKAKELNGKLYKIRYTSPTDPSVHVTIATTRPETLLADAAVAVHPDDERYAALHGKSLRIPLTDRDIPILTDTYVDREFGTGALKITPGHDVNDYEIGKRHKLPVLQLFDEAAKLTAVGGAYAGLTREQAREKVVEDLRAQGLLMGETEHRHAVGHCDRCSTILEPRVSAQWFVKAEVLAKPAIEAVEQKKVRILPEEWEKVYFEWMRNIRPWCVSRQLWWGHRIPAWHCKSCAHITVAVQDPTACEACQSSELMQDDDVLDTWFSSGLWPFSTLGWPRQTEDLKAFYPNAVMETGFDILFFWVARMMMMGIKMVGEIPFHTVYLHPMVRDEYGQKMSKTKGNVKDPLEIVGRVGADALRFTLAAMAVHGRDLSLSDARIEGYRNFGNKIWNASRFVLLHFGGVTKSHRRDDEVNRWIWASLDAAVRDVSTAIDNYRFFDAANRLYQFIWNEYCDWYLELIKVPQELEARKAEGDSTAVEVLDQALRLLHPFMPFVTEAIWQRLPLKDKGTSASICTAPYPVPSELGASYTAAKDQLDCLIALVEAVRTRRGEANLAPSKEIDVFVEAPSEYAAALISLAPLMRRLVRASRLEFSTGPADTALVMIPVLYRDRTFTVRIPREQLVDLASERERVAKELKSAEEELGRAVAKLNSEGFTGRAPADVVEGVRARKGALEEKVTQLKAYASTLGD